MPIYLFFFLALLFIPFEKDKKIRFQIILCIYLRSTLYIGRISLSQWSEAMESVTNFKLPWRLLREKLAVVTENNEIIYEKTLQMIENDDIVSPFHS